MKFGAPRQRSPSYQRDSLSASPPKPTREQIDERRVQMRGYCRPVTILLHASTKLSMKRPSGPGWKRRSSRDVTSAQHLSAPDRTARILRESGIMTQAIARHQREAAYWSKIEQASEMEALCYDISGMVLALTCPHRQSNAAYSRNGAPTFSLRGQSPRGGRRLVSYSTGNAGNRCNEVSIGALALRTTMHLLFSENVYPKPMCGAPRL